MIFNVHFSFVYVSTEREREREREKERICTHFYLYTWKERC